MSFPDIRLLLTSDIFIACFLPLVILLATYKHLPAASFAEFRDIVSPRLSRRQYGSFCLERAYFSYSQYARLSSYELTRMRNSYASLSRFGKNIGYKIGYPKKLDRLQHVTSLNTMLVDDIVEQALEDFPSLKSEPVINCGPADLGRARESLKHFVRDWSEEGATERQRIFTPILQVLRDVDVNMRANTKVLIPGCGLGRLAWEISQLGFDTTANELSFFMTLALRFILSPKTTVVNQHLVRPYAHWFSHQLSNDSLFRAISFPDAVPRLNESFRLVEQDFLQLKAPPGNANTNIGYDYIVTLFFIDTSLDVFTTMSHIYSLLRPGGVWINLGPLLWTGGAQSKVELNLEEVLHAAGEIGFVLDEGEGNSRARQTIECEYTGDRNAMMRWTYKAEFWVATKIK